MFVDTAPVMEKPLAAKAGLGWQGKHTNLVSREFGSWLFLGAIFTTAELAPDAPEADHCGACRRCLDVCPTNAFPRPTSSMRGAASPTSPSSTRGTSPPSSARPMGNRIFGCDDCLAVCPWNKFAQAAREAKLRGARRAATIRRSPSCSRSTMPAFRARFRGTPIKRTGRDRFVRNVLIAAGNSGDATLVAAGRERLGDASPLVRAMAVWALSRLAPRPGFGGACAASPCAGRSRPPWREANGRRIGGVSRLFCFGLGYLGARHWPRLRREGWQIAGTARDPAKSSGCGREGYERRPLCRRAGNPALATALAGATHLLHSIPPGPSGDPVLRHYRDEIAGAPDARLDRLSLDRRRLWRQAGGWVDESDPPHPDNERDQSAGRGRERTGSRFGEERPAVRRCSASPASTDRAAARSTSFAPAPRGASSSRGRCSTASMSRTSRACSKPRSRGRGRRHLQCHRRRAGAAAGRRRLCRRAAGHRAAARGAVRGRPISRPWRGASTATAAASPTR